MKTILVPTDFSPSSETALEFAARLAKNKHARLVIFHAYLHPVPVPQIPASIWQEQIQLLEAKVTQYLKEALEKIKHLGDLTYELRSEEGEPVKTILKKINELQPELIVMGTRSNGLASSIFGTTTLSVMEASAYPVFAVPEDCQPRQVIRKFTFASDFQETDIQSITALIDLARSYKAQVNVLHVSDQSVTPSEEVLLMNRFRQLVTNATNYNQLSFEMIAGGDIEEVLLRYILQGRTDVMVFSTGQRNFFERIFHLSVSKRIVLNSTIPILAFHYSKMRTFEFF